jgi:hypothetical protein
MSMNSRLDRRHDINAGERLPERFSRIQDMEAAWETMDRVEALSKDPEFIRKQQEEKEKVAMELAEKKASIKAGDVVFLLWTGVQVVRVTEAAEGFVKVGVHRYGWEMVKKPSTAFLEALRAELGEVEL